jgi:PAS domain S-box-containing protein/putative nucleotidyltransferase with HDIG domain
VKPRPASPSSADHASSGSTPAPQHDELHAALEAARKRVAELEAAQAKHAEAQDRLQESERRYRLLVESIQEGIGIVDPDEAIVFANQAYADIFGCKHTELLGRSLRDFVSDDAWARIRAETTLRREGRASVYELDVCGCDHRQRRIRVSAVPWVNGGGRFLGSIGCIVDVTEQTSVEQALRESTERWRRAVGGTVQAAAAISEKRDPYTAGHQRRVAKLSRAIAEHLAMTADEVEGVYLGALTHDVGKISIPAEILAKPGRLLPVEFELIKTHAGLGFEMLQGIEFPWPIADIALQHHERLDGSGYPQGLCGDAICREARIVAVADVVEAMASHRPYRAALGMDVALDEVRRLRGTGFDVAVADACLTLIAEKGFRFD